MSWPRARKVMRLLNSGETLEQIATRLQLSLTTVKTVVAAAVGVLPPDDLDPFGECPCCEAKMRLPLVGPGRLCLRCQVEAQMGTPAPDEPATDDGNRFVQLDIPAPERSEGSVDYLKRLERDGYLRREAMPGQMYRKRGKKKARREAEPTPETVHDFTAAIRHYREAYYVPPTVTEQCHEPPRCKVAELTPIGLGCGSAWEEHVQAIYHGKQYV